MSHKIITFSFDDGNPNDLRIATIMHEYNLKGTFYITTNKLLAGDLPEDNLRKMHEMGHEIGSHAMNHVNLKKIENCLPEMKQSKQILEEIIGDEVRMLSYPWGCYDETIIDKLIQVGYSGARTIYIVHPSAFLRFSDGRHIIDLKTNPYEMPITHIYEKQTPQEMLNIIQSFEEGKRAGVIHIFGHSWKFYNESDFNDFEWLLTRISELKIKNLTNYEIIKYQNVILEKNSAVV